MYVADSPLPDRLPQAIAHAAARERASSSANTVIVTGFGQSMEPLYESGTLMVVTRGTYDQLRRGQTVVYRNRANQAVAHVLVAKCRDGWRVAGLNNPRHDGEGVNPGNFLGLVVAAITPVRDQAVAAVRATGR